MIKFLGFFYKFAYKKNSITKKHNENHNTKSGSFN